jgi:ABC-type bacteriocin/lantibiotic exporter with double-glycine peptidase domain
MKIYRKNEDMSVTDITLNYKIKNVLAGLFISAVILVILSSFIPIKQNFIVQKVVVHDTIKELVVMKHGLTEITVDRNANILRSVTTQEH